MNGFDTLTTSMENKERKVKDRLGGKKTLNVTGFLEEFEVDDIKKKVDIVDVDAFVAVGFYHFERIFYFSQTALAEDIEFVKPDVFGHMHIKMRGWETFGQNVCGRIVTDWFFRD